MRCGGSQRDTSSYRCETKRDSSEKSGDLCYDIGGATESVIAGSPTLLFAVELTILYAAGSYVMGRLIRISGFAGSGNVLGHLAFYLLVFPGVVLHEGAHYLACLLTRTRVARFAPFSPGRTSDGRIVLGYVRHERRPFPIGAIIGLAPILLNPLGFKSIGARPMIAPMGKGRRS